LHCGSVRADSPPMRTAAFTRSVPQVGVRAARANDLDALIALERSVFAADCMSRTSLRHFLCSPTADVLIAECGGDITGCAIVLFRSKSDLARLYSIAVAPACEGCGVAPALLAAAEAAACNHRCAQLRLEVHECNSRAIACYRKAGFCEFGRHTGYYRDLGDALRFRKQLADG
jgi:ribosomal-protein-alanine N-acetyltransferase